MKTHILLSLILLTIISCNDDKKTQETKSVGQEEAEKTYELIWQDEFEVDGKPDTTRWDFEYGRIRNQEAQYYTDSLKNARVENGHLIVEAHKEQMEDAAYTSASITTMDIAEWKYGKFEVSAKLPKGRGLWPAIWMLSENWKEVGWPECGEIDIMEHVGYEKDTIYGTVHTKAYNHVIGTEKGGSVFIKDPYSEFHTYSVVWTPEQIDFLLDGMMYQQFKNEHKTSAEWPFDQNFHLKLNIAVGGIWGGLQGIEDSIFPQQMVVDYVRVYQLQ